MKISLTSLNESSAAQPAWTGKADVHYIFMWSIDASQCCDYDVISCGIEEQPERQAQHFRFQTVSNGEPLHVYHNRSPSSEMRLMDGRKKRICATLWNRVRAKSNAVQPAVVFGGDFNTSPLE